MKLEQIQRVIKEVSLRFIVLNVNCNIDILAISNTNMLHIRITVYDTFNLLMTLGTYANNKIFFTKGDGVRRDIADLTTHVHNEVISNCANTLIANSKYNDPDVIKDLLLLIKRHDVKEKKDTKSSK